MASKPKLNLEPIESVMAEELKARIAALIKQEIAPALQMDGTSIEVCHFGNGILQVRVGGGCGSCPSSVMAVLMGLEQELRRLVPEVEFVELEGT